MGVYITGIGVISALGRGWRETAAALRNNHSGLAPLTLFPHASPFAVGEVKQKMDHPDLPRTHQIALAAAEEALLSCGRKIPEAVVIGVTTGGMPRTELLLKQGADVPALYKYHAVGSVAEYIAGYCNCKGPVLTVSTACSSGALAVAIGTRLVQSGLVRNVLAGGVDALCRFTYHGFNALQLLSPEGARPFDRDRRGMSLSEGAAMFFLETGGNTQSRPIAEVLGLGLSCDAYHAASPHPEGRGAREAMAAAIRDAGLRPADVDSINLHGTGTISNDAAEAKAVNDLFGDNKPRLSSIKGALGHSLGAAGAIELTVSAISIAEKFIPANYGLKTPDPELRLEPLDKPEERETRTVLSNSFGFGGNNAALVVGAPRPDAESRSQEILPLAVIGNACVTGAGKTEATAGSFLAGSPCGGVLSLDMLSADLPSRAVRRLKRLPRMALCLAGEALRSANAQAAPTGVFFATGWGALSETNDFLTKLFKNNERFSSPMDFIGSVHNAPAGEIAMMFAATGPNVTMTGGDYSFEQALLAACLLGDPTGRPFLVVGADEYHKRLSPLFDASLAGGDLPADGGGGLCLRRSETGLRVRLVFFRQADSGDAAVRALIETLGGGETVQKLYGAVFAGLPGAHRRAGEKQIKTFQALAGSRAPVIDYRKLTGEFASASAVAVSLAIQCLQKEIVPDHQGRGKTNPLNGGRILVIGTGNCLTGVEVFWA